jgi:hypothetical protein
MKLEILYYSLNYFVELPFDVHHQHTMNSTALVVNIVVLEHLKHDSHITSNAVRQGNSKQKLVLIPTQPGTDPLSFTSDSSSVQKQDNPVRNGHCKDELNWAILHSYSHVEETWFNESFFLRKGW